MNCPHCGQGPLTRATRPLTLTCHGSTLTVDQPGDWCEACGEGLFSMNDLAVTEAARRSWMARAKENHSDSKDRKENS